MHTSRLKEQQQLKTNINNIGIAYDDHGAGQPILFLHAFPLNRSMWKSQIDALLKEQRYRLVSLDWRGFGESDIGSGVSTMEQLADDVAGLMDILGMQNAILCGLSMGGYVAFAFLRKYPQRVSGLILSDTRPGADNEEGKANREKVALLAESQGPAAIADLQLPRLISDDTRTHHPEVETAIRQMIYAATAQGIAAASRGMAQRSDSTDLLPTISCPTLVLVGENDPLTPPSVAQDYASHISGAQFTVLPSAGHLSNLEQPQAFLDAVYNFLRATF
jgi:pimeloyl-ACP methyl ester carboxylesterase